MAFGSMFRFAIVLMAAVLSLVHSHSRPQIHRISIENARQVMAVFRRSWDFSDCAPECKLMLGNRVLNQRNLKLTPLEAARLLPLLHSESLDERMYVWGEIATSAGSWLKENGQNVTSFSVEELDKIEGDIVVGRDEADTVLSGYRGENNTLEQLNRTKRKAVSFDGLLWKDTIQYKFMPNTFKSAEISLIKRSIKHWEDNTCVKFAQKSYNTIINGPHIKFVKKSGCWSFIGRQRRGQELSLGNTCFRMGVIAHEVGHALGLYHEQSRPDRDRYININYANIQGNPGVNFGAKNWRFVQSLGIPYDYSSALHYGSMDFTSNGRPTMRTKDPKMMQVLGQREMMSYFDFKIVNLLYCSEKCGGDSLEWSYCQNGGYRDPKNCNSCICPLGFAAPNCADVMNGVNIKDCGQKELLATDKEKQLKSPGYPNGYVANADCAWRIRAPGNQRIRLQFTGQFYIQAIRPTCHAYVEVRYKDVTRVGPRYCWYRAPKDILLSHGNEALIVFHTKKEGYRGFQLTYIAEQCGGCSNNAASDEPVCYRTEEYDCSVEVNTICVNRLCKKKRLNTCFREKTYCCNGYTKSGDKCTRSFGSNLKAATTKRTTSKPTTTQRTTRRITFRPPPTTRRTTTRRTTQRPTTTRRTTTTTTTTTTTQAPTVPEPQFVWGSWGAWTRCSASCGLCGNRVRRRFCNLGICPGRRTEAQSCGSEACPDSPPITIRRLCDSTGKVCPFPIGSNCVGARVCLQEIPPLKCCDGKHVLNECVLDDLKLF